MTNAVALTNLDRVLWPRTGFTKGDMVAYYRAIAPAVLPHLEARAVTLWRYPNGVDGPNWWQNECRGAPDWVRTHDWRGQRFCVIDDADTLVWVANLGTVELHPFLHRVDDELPTWIVFDLDPGPPSTVVECCEVALLIRDRLGGVAKTSGAAGLHVYVEANGRSYEETKALARAVTDELAAEHELVVAVQSRAERRGRVLIDWLQNDAARSTIAPYSLRGAPLPTVATPVTWGEVERCASERRPELLFFLADELPARIERFGDLLLERQRPGGAERLS